MTAAIQTQRGDDAEGRDQRQADAEGAVGVPVLGEPVAQEEHRHGVDDGACDGADGRAGYQVTPGERPIQQQPGGDQEEPELQCQQHGRGD
jgi:hypothetical protein